MKPHAAIGLAIGLLQVACAAPATREAKPNPSDGEAEPAERDENSMDSEIRFSFELLGIEVEHVEYRWSNRTDDVDCKHWRLVGWVRPHATKETGPPSRRGSPERALYEWHLCFEIGGRSYRGWRGFDPGRGSTIELECRIDAREPPPDLYACRRTKLEIGPENYADAAYACREGEPCRRFESEQEYLAWKALPILTREEVLAATAALIRQHLARLEPADDDGEPTDYYVNVIDQDLPRDLAASLSGKKDRFHPASEQPDDDGVSMTFGNFLRKSDGTMQVDYGYYCGPLCAGSYTAIMKKNASGDWEVLSVETNWVS